MMAQSGKELEREERVRAMIERYTPEDLAEAQAARREFGPSYGYANGTDWWDTMVRSYPKLFKGENPPERPAWLDAPAPKPAAPAEDDTMTEAKAYLLAGGHSHPFLVDVAAQLVGKGRISDKQAQAVLRFKGNAKPAAGAPAPATTSPAVPVAPVTKEQVSEGMYRVADGTIYKVQVAVHGSGQLYAKRLVRDVAVGNVFGAVDQGRWTFEYEKGAIRKLRPSDKMTLDEAKAFGALYGTCCVCGRTLTDEGSIAAGIGPVCAGKEGWWAD